MRPCFRIAAVLCLALGTDAAFPAGAQDAQAEAPQFSVGDWYLKDGTDGEVLQTTIAVDSAGMRVETRESGETQHYDPQLNVYRNDADSWSVYFEPSIMKYSFPLFVGKEWTGVFTVRTERADGLTLAPDRIEYRCRVECIERVTVPAGAFETFKASCERKDLGDGSHQRETYWFAPVAGISVRQVKEEFHPERGWIQYAETTLLDYEFAHSATFNVLPDGVESTCEQAISMNESEP